MITRVIHNTWPVCFIGVIWFLFTMPFFVHGRVPFPSSYLVTFFPPWNAQYTMPVKNNAMPDVATQIFPWKHLTMEIWKNNSIPLWNPYSFAGTPHAGNFQSAVFSPFNLLFFLFPFVTSWSILILLQPLLAGVFMYMLLRSLERSIPGSLVGALAFMFSGFMVTWMAYGTLGYAVLWLPLILWGIVRIMNARDSKGLLATAGGTAISFLSGHFQISLYVIGAGVFFILYQSYIRKNWKLGLLPIACIIIGLLIALPQLALSFDAYMNSARSTSHLMQDLIPWQYIVTFIAPDFFGNPVTRNNWFGHYAEWMGYAGVVPLVMAGFTLLCKKNSTVWFFIILGISSLLLSYKNPLLDLLLKANIPVFSTSAASRIIVLVSVSIAILSAFGIDRLRDIWAKREIKGVMLMGLGILTCLIIAWVAVFLLPKELKSVSLRNMVLPSLLAVASCGLAAVGFSRFFKWKTLIFAILIGIAAFDGLRFAVKWMPFESPQYLYPKTETIQALERIVKSERLFGNLGGEVGVRFAHPLIEGYDAMYQKRYGEFIQASSDGIVAPTERSVVMFDKHGRYAKDVLEFLAVRYVLHRKSDGRNIWAFPVWQYPDMKLVWEDAYYQLYEHESAYPRAFVASSYKLADDDQEIIDNFFNPAFDRRNSVVVEKEPLFHPQEGSGEASIISDTPNEVRIKTNTSVPKLLVLTDAYNKNWQVEIDGTRTQLMRADYAFRAVAVEKGEHTVRFFFWPPYLTAVLVISVISIVTLVITAVRSGLTHSAHGGVSFPELKLSNSGNGA